MKYYLTADWELEQPRPGDAGFDIRANEVVHLHPGDVTWVETGLHIAVPKGYVGIVKERSSKAKAYHVQAGVIDSSYRGEVKVCVRFAVNSVDIAALTLLAAHVGKSTKANVDEALQAWRERYLDDTVYTIEPGEKIAQLLIIPVQTPQLVRTTKLQDLGVTLRGDKGFGSTDDID